MNKSIQYLIEELITRSRELDLLVIEESRLRILQKETTEKLQALFKEYDDSHSSEPDNIGGGG
ncbi:MAG: hypothetical protein RIS10_905 [Pseudomonadota bacterium]